MRIRILTGCLWILSIIATAQDRSRIPSGIPLKWGMNGSVEIMPGDLAYYYGSTDSSLARRRALTSANTALGGNPNTTYFRSVQAQCDNNSMLLSWVAVQQFGADRYEIEQSTDGRKWEVVGVIPANRTDFGEASYNFTYNKNTSNVIYRIGATSTGGERTFSSILESPCSPNSTLGVTSNPVYSSTTVRIGSPGTARVRLILLDNSGRLVQTSEASLISGVNSVPLDMSRLTSGNYTLVIRWTNGREQILKLIKE